MEEAHRAALEAKDAEISRLEAELEAQTSELTELRDQLDAFRKQLGTVDAAAAQKWWLGELRCLAMEVAGAEEERSTLAVPARLRKCFEQRLCAALDGNDTASSWDQLWSRAVDDERAGKGAFQKGAPDTEQQQQQQLTALLHGAHAPRGDPEAEAAAAALRSQVAELQARLEVEEQARRAAEERADKEAAAREAAEAALAAGTGEVGAELAKVRQELAEAQQGLATAQEALQQATSRGEEMEARIQDLEEQLRQSQAKAEAEAAAAQAARQELEAALAGGDAATASAQQRLQQLEEQAAAAQAEATANAALAARYQGESQSLGAEVIMLEGALQAAVERAATLEQTAATLRAQLSGGDELAQQLEVQASKLLAAEQQARELQQSLDTEKAAKEAAEARSAEAEAALATANEELEQLRAELDEAKARAARAAEARDELLRRAALLRERLPAQLELITGLMGGLARTNELQARQDTLSAAELGALHLSKIGAGGGAAAGCGEGEEGEEGGARLQAMVGALEESRSSMLSLQESCATGLAEVKEMERATALYDGREAGDGEGTPEQRPEAPLEIFEIRAFDVPDADGKRGSGGSDPYMSFTLLETEGEEQTVKTQAFEDVKNPQWPDRLTLRLPRGSPRPPLLRVVLWDQDFTNADDPVGIAEAPLAAVHQSVGK